MLVLTLMLATQPSVQKLTEDYLHALYVYSPMTATGVGYHKEGLDRRLDDVSPAARKRRVAFLRQMAGEIAALDRAKLSPDERADVRLLDENIALELLNVVEARDFARRPDRYVGDLGSAFFNMMAREYGPLDQRGADVAARLREVPRYLEQARKNIEVDVDAFREAALDDGKGLADFLREDLAHAFAGSAAKGDIGKALPPALKAIAAYLSFVEEKLPKLKKADFRYGRALYDKRFGHYLQTDLAPDEILGRAKKQIAEVRAELLRLARPLYKGPQSPAPSDDAVIRSVLADIARDHTTPDGMLAQAREQVEREKAFVRDHHILTLPATDNLKVMETPPFMRSSYGVAGFDGAPPLTPDLGAFYYVTPYPKDWPKEKTESKLREYNKWTMELISIHEAMPGHYVQLQWANRVEPEWRRAARSILSSTAYVEGWAVFAEDFLLEAGYLKDPRMRLSYLKATLRSLANTVLDIGLHSRDMTEADAMKLMVEDTFQEKTEAELKLRRARLDVTQLCSYFVGFEEWRSIRDAARKAGGKAFDQKVFLDRALRYGGVALPSLRELMLAPAAGGGGPTGP